MSMRNLVLFASDSLVSVRVKFSDDDKKHYTYIAEKTLADTLMVDDFAIVSNSLGKFATVRVVGIDEFVDIDPKSDIHYEWLVQKIDNSRVKTLNENLAVNVKELEARQRKAYRQQILNEMTKDGSLVLSSDIPDSQS